MFLQQFRHPVAVLYFRKAKNISSLQLIFKTGTEFRITLDIYFCGLQWHHFNSKSHRSQQPDNGILIFSHDFLKVVSVEDGGGVELFKLRWRCLWSWVLLWPFWAVKHSTESFETGSFLSDQFHFSTEFVKVCKLIKSLKKLVKS